MKVPGSPSSALITRYLGAVEPLGMNPHLTPVGKAAPPSPRRLDFFTSSAMAAGSIAKALPSAVYPPVAR